MTRLATAQAELFAVDDLLPPGLDYASAFVTAAEEAELLALLATLPMAHATHQQYTARRRVHFIEPDLLPPPLQRLRDRLAAWAGVAPADFVHALVSEYRPGTPLGWHRDAPQYEVVCGVSLGGPATLRFRPWPVESPKAADIVALDLAPRSAYAMRGPARWGWQHGVPPVKALRWSVTMRTARPAGDRPPRIRG